MTYVSGAAGGPDGDLRWRSSLRMAPAPHIYEVMGDHGSPPGPPIASQYPRGARDLVPCADRNAWPSAALLAVL